MLRRRATEGSALLGDELLDLVRGEPLDVRDRPGPFEHDLRGAELVPAVDDFDVLGELGQEDRLLHRRVAAADDRRRDVAEEGGVAGRAVADASAGEGVLAVDAELAVLGAHRQDHGAGQVDLIADEDPVQAAVGGQLDARDLIGLQARAEALGLVAHLVHQLGTHDPLGKPG